MLYSKYRSAFSRADICRSFTRSPGRAGFEPERTWVDDAGLFSVHYMSVP
jgi:hypothetical protein